MDLLSMFCVRMQKKFGDKTQIAFIVYVRHSISLYSFPPQKFDLIPLREMLESTLDLKDNSKVDIEIAVHELEAEVESDSPSVFSS